MFNRNRYIGLFLALLAVIMALALTGFWEMINVVILLVCVVSYFYDKSFILFLFIIFLPTNGLISTDYNLLGLINIQRLINMFTIIVLYEEGNKNEFEAKNDNFIKYAKRLLIFMLLYNIYKEYNNYMYQLSSYVDSFKTLINRFIKYFLLFYSSILYVKYIKDEKLIKLFNFSLIASILFMSVTQIFSLPLFKIGFETWGIFEEIYGRVYGVEASELGRSAGFYGYGDQNSMGAFLVIAIGYLLARNEKHENMLQFIIVMLIAVISIIKTGSRTAFVMLALLFGIYFIRNWKSSKVLFMFVLSIFAFIVIIDQTNLLDNALSRFDMLSGETNANDDTTRIYKWLTYLDFMFSNVFYFLTGAKEQIIVLAGRYRAAHNLYIQMLYNTGIIFVGYFFLWYFKYFNFTFSGKNKYFVPYYLLPFLSITLVTSEWSNSLFLAFYIAINEKIEK